MINMNMDTNIGQEHIKKDNDMTLTTNILISQKYTYHNNNVNK